MKQLDLIQDDALVRQLQKKMAPPLVTLLSAEPEIQFVALRNINLIVQKAPQILSHEVKVRHACMSSDLQHDVNDDDDVLAPPPPLLKHGGI